ncbi:MAG: hypothetical protein JRM74_00025 [Nitrososphaerota archaeon]|nr:hypothetical protein [Nitrososphaerota archaeon]
MINYRIRPAKSVERKMLCSALLRLRAIAKLESYRYIGFGSTFFTDFALFHRTLGIRDNISIERDVGNKKRFLFNRPYKCVEIEFGESKYVLPKISWNQRTIVWLDYDGTLDNDVLSDVSTICANALAGSVLIVTVNAEPGKMEDRAKSLEMRLTKEKLPPGVLDRPQDLDGWGTAKAYRRIISNEMESTLAHRNGLLPIGSKLHYRQLFNFNYRDSSRMLTAGGIIYDEATSHHLDGCQFEMLDFVKPGDVPYLIDAPVLTLKEMRHLDEQLPRAKGGRFVAINGIPRRDLLNYERLYRYFPSFVDAELE